MRIGRLAIAIVTLTPPKAPEPAPMQGPELEDLTVTATPRVIDGRTAYVRRRNLAVAHERLSFEDVMARVIAGTAIKARLLRHFKARTEPVFAARRRRTALLGKTLCIAGAQP